MPDSSSPKKGRPRGSESFAWRAFFQQSTTPIYVLGRNRRLRFANAAWEKLAGVKLADALGMVCSARRTSTPLAAALAPTLEAEEGKADRVRRAAPAGRGGAPWWDISFAPLEGEKGILGIVGLIALAGEAERAAARKLPAVVASLRDKHATHFTLDLFAGTAAAATRFQGQLRHVAQSFAPVWLVGERGAGKETAARVIHHSGPRRDRAFVAVDAGGLQPYLVESLLFGRGALLDSPQLGTLYLKDPAGLPRDLQQRIADSFAGNPPTRLISGSVRTARGDVATGKLVSEFHSTLAVLELQVPPLRDRLADLPRLIAHLQPDLTVDAAALAVLAGYDWPGNIRELADVLAAAAASAGRGVVTPAHLPHELRVKVGIDVRVAGTKSVALDPLLEAVEKRMIELALRKSSNHQTDAAELLGIFRARLWRRLEALGIPIPPQPPKPRKDQAEAS